MTNPLPIFSGQTATVPPGLAAPQGEFDDNESDRGRARRLEQPTSGVVEAKEFLARFDRAKAEMTLPPADLMRGWEFDLTLDGLPRPTHCPIFGVELVYQAVGKRRDNSASIDRIDSSRGYTRDNVWVICWRANQIKSNATLDELRALCDALGKAAAGRLLDGVEHNGFPA